MTPQRRALVRSLLAWLEAFREAYPRRDARDYLAAWAAGLSVEVAVKLAPAQLRELSVALYSDVPTAPRPRRTWLRGAELLTARDAAALDHDLEQTK